MCLRRSVAVALAAEHAEERDPRADRLAMAVRQGARNLMEMGEVVRGPCGEELAQRDGPEDRMGAAPVEIGFREPPAAQRLEISGP